MTTSERRHSLSKERKSCRARILRMLKKKNFTIEELMTLYEEKNIFLFKGHEKEFLYITLLEGNDIDMLTGNVQDWPSLHRKIIRRAVDREGSTLKEFGEKKLHKDVRAELDKMIQNEKEQNKKQEEEKMISIPRRRWNVGVRLATHRHVHLLDVIKLTEESHLILSNQTFCGEPVTHDNMLNLSNKATCPACLREDAKRNSQA